ncbi:HNH endonuclease signature motif containing protein [Aeromicrobium sp. CF3.5]|uniref:HNH endonuclease signature motif containing protein n=1 Tax=Aeromicrobium sp. CF3.5 TaxID=3373078 RepID=UPI003EE487BB
MCGNDGTWMGAPLTLEIDHIDGDFQNNQIMNLRFLCPNCHRLTPNFAGRGRGRFTGT